MMLPFRYGGAALTGRSSWLPPPPHPPRVNAREAPSVARRKADMVVLRRSGIVMVVGPGASRIPDARPGGTHATPAGRDWKAYSGAADAIPEIRTPRYKTSLPQSIRPVASTESFW